MSIIAKVDSLLVFVQVIYTRQARKMMAARALLVGQVSMPFINLKTILEDGFCTNKDGIVVSFESILSRLHINPLSIETQRDNNEPDTCPAPRNSSHFDHRPARSII